MYHFGNKLIDLNGMLQIINIIIGFYTIINYLLQGETRYINAITIVLSLVLVLQTSLALVIEKNKRNQFIIILAINIIIFYSLRIITLNIYDFSVVYERIGFSSEDLNYSLLFIIIANLFLYAGIISSNIDNKNYSQNVDKKNISSKLRLMIFWFALINIFSLTNINYWNAENIPRIINFIVLFFDPIPMLIIIVVFYITYYKKISKLDLFYLFFIISVEIIITIFQGSRSGLLKFFWIFISALLASNPKIFITFQKIRLGILLSPLVILSIYWSFNLATNIRTSLPRDSFDFINIVEVAFSTFNEYKPDDASPLAFFFERIGYLDFSSEIIANNSIYSRVVNLPAYIKSVIDNLLTPGFDIYDQAKVAYSIWFAYKDLGEPLKSIAATHQQTDQMGIYGELYVLCSYWSLPIFFIITYCIGRIYKKMSSYDLFLINVKRTLLLIIFYNIINSFGLDGLIIDNSVLIIQVLIYSYLFSRYKP
jgi:hypothetical protein